MFTSTNLDEIDYNPIYFTYQYITDELVYYGLKKQVARSLFKLSELFFTTVFEHDIFNICKSSSSDKKPVSINPSAHQILSKWLTTLGYFLSYFPEPKSSLSLLRNINQQLQLPQPEINEK